MRQNSPDGSQDLTDSRIDMEKGFQENMFRVVERDKDKPYYDGKNFYVICVYKTEPFSGQPQFMFFSRQSCPTPIYQQIVYKYHRLSGGLEFLWTIPDLQLCREIRDSNYKKDNAGFNQLYEFVYLLDIGKLLEMAKRENNEDETIEQGALIIH